jgi:hypothetical protein
MDLGMCMGANAVVLASMRKLAIRNFILDELLDGFLG